MPKRNGCDGWSATCSAASRTRSSRGPVGAWESRSSFRTLRNEHALHRWDIAGDDEISRQLLGSMDLVGHSVGELGRILLAAGRRHDPEPDSGFHVRLRAEGQPDLRVVVENGDATLAWAGDEANEAAVDFDAGARQLFIWGRRPDHRGRLRSHLAQPDLARLQVLLSGY